MLKDAWEWNFAHIGHLANMLRLDFAPTHKDKQPEYMQLIKIMADIAQIAVFVPNAAIWYRVRLCPRFSSLLTPGGNIRGGSSVAGGAKGRASEVASIGGREGI
jgi:hypothetical protein